MLDQDKSKPELIEELAEMRRRIAVLESAESERQGNEDHYRLLTDAIPQMLWRADANRQTIECNRRWYEYTDETPEEARGLGWMKPLHPDDLARVTERMREALAAGEPYQAEYRVRRASDGKYRWHLSRALPMKDEDGRITGWFGSVTDIDDQKQAEEALAEREARLLEAQEVANLGFYVIDLATGRCTTSSVLDRLFGIPADYPRTIDSWVNLVHPDDRQEMLDGFKKAVGEKKPTDLEYRIVRFGDKQVRWVHGLGRLRFSTGVAASPTSSTASSFGSSAESSANLLGLFGTVAAGAGHARQAAQVRALDLAQDGTLDKWGGLREGDAIRNALR